MLFFTTSLLADPVFSLGPDRGLCDGDSMILAPGVPNAAYLWQDGSTNPTYTVQQPGLYWVEVTDATGSSRDSLWVGYLPVPFLDFPGDTLLCESNSLFLNVSTIGASYRWQDGSTDSRFQVSEPGLYHVTVTNPCGVARDSILVDYHPLPKVDLGPDTVLCEGESLLFNLEQGQGNTFTWENGSNIPVRIIEESGIYFAEVTNYCGSLTDSLRVEVIYCDCTVFLANAFTPNADGYNDRFGPSFDCAFERYQFQVFDRWGRAVFVSEEPSKQWDGNLNGRSCPEGVYMWLLSYDSAFSGPQQKQGSLTLFR